MAKVFGRNVLTPLKGSKKRGGGRSTSSNASMSVVSDNETLYSAEGQQSVAAKTVDSQATQKASNKHVSEAEGPHHHKKESTPWKTIKRLVGKKSPPGTPNRGHAPSYDSESERSAKSSRSAASSSGVWSAYPVRKRILSLDAASPKRASSHRVSGQELAAPSKRSLSVRDTCELDLAIKGRLDGMDTMSLGSASRALMLSSERRRREKAAKVKSPPSTPDRKGRQEDPDPGDDSELNIDPLTLSFTGKPVSCTPVDVVFDMLWASDGKDQPELIFEGYIPGGSDRWAVRLEDAHEEPPVLSEGERASSPERSHSKTSTDDDESTAVMTEDGSPNMPAHRLWDQIWGDDCPPPLPSHMQAGAESNKDEVLQLAAACSVPVDLDEDTFMIESPEHLRAVHDLTMVPLQGRRFESALMIFNNLLTGLKGTSGEKLEHLIGVTHHNIGILHMCQGHFGDALKSFKEAVAVRKECLPQNHPDIAVSLAREGTAYFALESFDRALRSFNMALDMCPNEDATRAKLLNSIGVVHSFRRKYSDALKAFTSALEIQRVWLEGPVRRESIIYDASMTLCNMGKIYLQRGDYDLSYFVYEEACVLQTTAFRKDHEVVLTSLENMSRVLAKRDDYEKASQILSSTLRSQQNRFGADSECCIETRGMLGYMHAKLLDFNLSLTHLNAVSNWQYTNLSASHPSIQITREIMTSVRSRKDGEASLWI